MKRKVAIPLLILANIFVLAHAFVPHHHHDQAVVALTVFQHEGAENCTAHKHHHCGNDLPVGHDCTGHEQSEECFIQNAFTDTEKRQHSESCLCCPHPVSASIAFNDFVPENNVLAGETFLPKPIILTYHYRYLTRSLGLRAPPVC